MVVHDKSYFQSQINNLYIYLKIILHNYILYKGNLSDVRIFPAKLGIAFFSNRLGALPYIMQEILENQKYP